MIDPASKQRMLGFDYVFVNGATVPGVSDDGVDFSMNAETLRHLAAPESVGVWRIQNSANKSIQDNSKALLASLSAMVAKNNRRLVLIGHSKGAAEIMALAVQNSGWFEQNVAASFLIEAAFGTPLADFLVGKGCQLDREFSLGQRIAVRIMRNAFDKKLNLRCNAGVQSLTTGSQKEFWHELQRSQAQNVAAISNRIYYIRGSIACSQCYSSDLKLTRKYLTAYYDNQNDGVIRLADQKLPWIGVELMHLPADHYDLSSKQTSRSIVMREALFTAIFLAMGRSEGE